MIDEIIVSYRQYVSSSPAFRCLALARCCQIWLLVYRQTWLQTHSSCSRFWQKETWVWPYKVVNNVFLTTLTIEKIYGVLGNMFASVGAKFGCTWRHDGVGRRDIRLLTPTDG
jgi:hypothetical protein